MATMEDQIQTTQDEVPELSTNGHNSVNVHLEDTVGATFLGILSLILLVGWVRAEARYRALLARG